MTVFNTSEPVVVGRAITVFITSGSMVTGRPMTELIEMKPTIL